MNVASSLTLTKPEVEQLLIGKNEISDYLAKIVLDAYGDLKTILMMTTGFRFSYLAGREDRENEYLFQFPTTEFAPSRVIWDISTVAFLKNPNWALSTEETSPVLNDNLTWGPKNDSRHKIRVVNFCHRDLIFGDMIACLTRK